MVLFVCLFLELVIKVSLKIGGAEGYLYFFQNLHQSNIVKTQLFTQIDVETT